VSGASPPEIVGRAAERAAIADAVAVVHDGRSGMVVVVEGEPGIGKSRLLEHLATVAVRCTVLTARASEFEADLPYALWTEALDRHLAGVGERRVARLGLADPGALAVAVPAVAPLGGEAGDRHRVHRALRDLLERLAAPRPLVLCLDDVHWADPASLDALAAVVRRPPSGPVLIALATREGQQPAVLATALGAAAREDRMTALTLGPLSEAEAVELVGAPATTIYALAGGNPFYLQQLARVSGAARDPATIGADAFVPAAVAAALAAELGGLSARARTVIDAAAVAGDPFDAALAAEIAAVPEPEALAALDELLAGALVRPATPGRFAFRHPVVRHAVYAGTPGGWRVGAHARAANALRRRGAGAAERAHHVERSAGPGDDAAIALLRAAAEELHAPAPATAARFFAAALRLLPEGAPARTELHSRLADAQAAAGDAAAARQTLLDALRGAPDDHRLALTVSLANQEWWLGGHEDARRRLHVALAGLPAEPSPDRIRLRLALALTALMACELDDAAAHASDARDDARAIGDPVFEGAALAAGALASASNVDAAAADRLADSVAAVERLTPAQLATRIPALWMQGRAHRALGAFAPALASLERGLALATETGRERVLLVLRVESVAVLIELGRLADAAAAAEEGVELARLAGSPRTLLWALSARSRACLELGDVSAAVASADEAAELDAEADFHAAGQPGWCRGAALLASGNPERALPALLGGFGGPALARVLPADRPAAAADLVDALLASGDVAAAEEAIGHGGADGIARAGVLLARGRPGEAVAAAMASREEAVDAPFAAGRARLVEGRALAAAGQQRAAIEALVAAEAAFDGFGARRRRDEAVRELRRLGHRVVRRARDGTGPLTAREREIAALVAAGRTNREIASQLVLSTRTIEAHLRNIYAKLEVRSRVELAREADATASPTSLG
jgi:DNA-binding NarL/FixJ family response regulator